MAETKIEWADVVWNPITGCTPISEGCQNCYARRIAYRLKGRFGYPENDPFRVTFHGERLEEPLKWKKSRRIFVCSMGDLFHENIPFEWINDIFGIIMMVPQHVFMLLTKRPERALEYHQYSEYEFTDGSGKLETSNWEWPVNIWLGVTAENQKRADERIPVLLQIPASERFVSIEPMLGPIDLLNYLGLPICNTCSSQSGLSGDGWCQYRDECPEMFQETPGLDWIIVGAETGPGARPMDADWARSIRDQCEFAEVPFFFKRFSFTEPPKDLNIRQFP